jgi:hypothetical protein
LAGEALSHVQSESLKGGAAVTAVRKLPGHQHLLVTAQPQDTEVSVIGKKPLDFILRQFHDAMDELLDYERDNSFVPSKDQLVLFARLHAQLRQFAFTLHVLNRKMRDRAKGIG